MYNTTSIPIVAIGNGYTNGCTVLGVSVLHVATIGMEVVLYISAWGFCVARFDRMGNSQEPLIVKRATVLGFTLFLCLN